MVTPTIKQTRRTTRIAFKMEELRQINLSDGVAAPHIRRNVNDHGRASQTNETNRRKHDNDTSAPLGRTMSVKRQCRSLTKMHRTFVQRRRRS